MVITPQPGPSTYLFGKPGKVTKNVDFKKYMPDKRDIYNFTEFLLKMSPYGHVNEVSTGLGDDLPPTRCQPTDQTQVGLVMT